MIRRRGPGDDERRPGQGAAPNVEFPGEGIDAPKVAPATNSEQCVDRSGLDAAAENADEWWWSCAWQAVQQMANTGRVFQAHDLVDELGLAEPDHPNRWGALLHKAADDGLIEPVGAEKSRRPSRAGGLTRTWKGTAA